jgi:hypothetical protein
MVEPENKPSKKTLGSIDMNSSRLQSASSTGEGFFRKTGSKSFTTKADQLGTIIQIIKSDIFQVQETINENASVMKMSKIMSTSSSLSKKISEIEDNRDIKSTIDKLTDDSNNVEMTCKNYNCNNLNELVQKLTLEVNYYDLFIKKINELFFIWNLKLKGEDNLYQDTFSKFFLIKLVLDKVAKCGKDEFTNTVDTTPVIITSTNDKSDAMREDSSGENNKLAEIKNINDIINEYNNGENSVLKNIVNIFKDFLNKLSINYADLINKNGKKVESFDGLQFNNFLTQKLVIEKIISEKSSEINALNSSYSDLNKKNAEYEEIISRKDKEIDELTNKLKNAKTIESSIAEQPKDVKSLLKIIEESI